MWIITLLDSYVSIKIKVMITFNTKIIGVFFGIEFIIMKLKSFVIFIIRFMIRMASSSKFHTQIFHLNGLWNWAWQFYTYSIVPIFKFTKSIKKQKQTQVITSILRFIRMTLTFIRQTQRQHYNNCLGECCCGGLLRTLTYIHILESKH